MGLLELVVEFIIDDAAKKVACKRVPGVDRDWTGTAYGRKPAAGPFQQLQACPELSNGTDYRSPNRGPLENEALKRLFERILDESRRVERIVAEDRKQGDG